MFERSDLQTYRKTKSVVFMRSMRSANLREASRMNRVWSVACERVSNDARRGVSSIS